MIERISNLLAKWQLSGSGWIIALIVLGVSLVIFLIFSLIFRSVRNRYPDNLLGVAWQKFRVPVLVIFLLTDFILLNGYFTREKEHGAFTGHFITVAIIFCVSWLIIRSVHLARVVILRQYDISEKDNLKARKVFTQLRILERIVIFIVVLISLAIALMTFDSIKRIGFSLFASAGVAGIIIGFAAQKLLGSILAGFQIALTQPIRIDDVVIVENEWGWIEEITLTYVVVRIWDRRRLIVPTTYFIEKPFQNWTRVSSDILGTVYIYCDYHVPVDALRKAFTGILEGTDLWDGKTSVMQVTNATDRTLEIRALMSAADSPTAWDLRVLVREKLISWLQEHHPENLPRTRIELTPKEGDRQS